MPVDWPWGPGPQGVGCVCAMVVCCVGFRSRSRSRTRGPVAPHCSVIKLANQQPQSTVAAALVDGDLVAVMTMAEKRVSMLFSGVARWGFGLSCL